jgi:hypothetical protein
MQMTEVDTPSGMGVDHAAQDGLAHLDTAVWWRYSTGLIALVAGGLRQAPGTGTLNSGTTCCQLRSPTFYPMRSAAMPTLQFHFLVPDKWCCSCSALNSLHRELDLLLSVYYFLHMDIDYGHVH